MRSLQGHVVVIMDGTSALGRQMAMEFARLDAKVVLWGPDDAAIQQVVFRVVSCHGGVVRGYRVNLHDRASIELALHEFRRDFPRIDVLVCNTDERHLTPLLATSTNDLAATMTANAMAPLWATRLVLPQMLEQRRGQIVLFGTSAAALGAPALVDYCASKAAVEGLFESLQHELRGLQRAARTNGDRRGGAPTPRHLGVGLTLVRPTLVRQTPMDGGGGDARATTTGETRSESPPWIWLSPQATARRVVRVVQRNRPKITRLELPGGFGMARGLVGLLPEGAQGWLRGRLGWSTAVDRQVRVPMATPTPTATTTTMGRTATDPYLHQVPAV